MDQGGDILGHGDDILGEEREGGREGREGTRREGGGRKGRREEGGRQNPTHATPRATPCARTAQPLCARLSRKTCARGPRNSQNTSTLSIQYSSNCKLISILALILVLVSILLLILILILSLIFRFPRHTPGHAHRPVTPVVVGRMSTSTGRESKAWNVVLLA